MRLKTAQIIVKALLESIDYRTRQLPPEEHEELIRNAQVSGAERCTFNGASYYVDSESLMLLPVNAEDAAYEFGDELDFEEFLYTEVEGHAMDDGMNDAATYRDEHDDVMRKAGIEPAPTSHRWGSPDPDPIPLEAKMQYRVFESGDFVFIKMPSDHNFVRREGIDMQHCLQWAYVDYCKRLDSGAQEQFSMIDKRDGMPKVDIELSVSQSSYAGPVKEKTITQIRGIRNECPPKDEYIGPIMDFLQNYGKGWVISGHGVRNFDGRSDGDRVVKRWEEMQRGKPRRNTYDY